MNTDHLPLIKHHAVYQAFCDDRPFRVMVMFTGHTKNGNRSQKWWEIYYTGSGSVRCNHGKVGSSGRTQPFEYDVWKALDKLQEKLNKGYKYVRGTSDGVPMASTPEPELDPDLALPSGSLDHLAAPLNTIFKIVQVDETSWRAEDVAGSLIANLDEDGVEEIKRLAGMVA